MWIESTPHGERKFSYPVNTLAYTRLSEHPNSRMLQNLEGGMCGDSRGLTHAGTKCKRATEISEACHAESCPTPTSDFVCITTGADLSPSPHGQRHPVPSRTIAQCGVSKHLRRKKNTESGTMVAACGRDSRHRIGPRFGVDL
jgi:hypothetical protein